MTEPAAPASADAEPVDAAEGPGDAVAPRTRRRAWVVVLVVVGSLVVLGVVAFLVADGIAKGYARDYVRARVVEVLHLPADADVDVDLGGGSIILQALAGRVDEVDVHAPGAAFGELRGTVDLHAEGVPLDAAAPVERLRVAFATGPDDLAAVQGGDDPDAPDVVFEDGGVSLSSSFELFGAEIPWGLSVEPSAADGDLVLTPTSLTFGTETFEPGADDDSFLGQIVGVLLQPQTLCIADNVPQALVLEDAAIDDRVLVLTFRGDGAALGGPEFSTPGTCPAA